MKIWAGSRNNHVGFAENEKDLIDQGYQNPVSFDTTGEVQNLNLISKEAVKQSAQSGSGPATA